MGIAFNGSLLCFLQMTILLHQSTGVLGGTFSKTDAAFDMNANAMTQVAVRTTVVLCVS